MKTFKEIREANSSAINPEYTDMLKNAAANKLQKGEYVKYSKTYVTPSDINNLPYDAFFYNNANKEETSGSFRTYSLDIKYLNWGKLSSLPLKGPSHFMTYKNILVAIITSDPSKNNVWSIKTVIPGAKSTINKIAFDSYAAHKQAIKWVESKHLKDLTDLFE